MAYEKKCFFLGIKVGNAPRGINSKILVGNNFDFRFSLEELRNNWMKTRREFL
jgi:hypothetical protein